jgi:4-azaleucine resistance transporter AzlC
VAISQLNSEEEKGPMQDKSTDSNLGSEYSRGAFLQGVINALPIVFGYIPIGLAFGILAKKSGLSDTNTMLISIMVYAGSSQFIAVSLFETNAPGITIILTTLIVNLRHLLMSAAIAPYLKGWRRRELAAFSFHLTDETFALYSLRFPNGVPPKAEILGTNVTAQVSWVLGTWLGLTLGQMIGDIQPLGLDYALPAMFVALLVMQVKNKAQVGTALLAGGLSVGLMLLGMGRWNLILATFLGATAGALVETWNKT